jgi:hypothetical protein
MNGFFARFDFWWIALATNPFPVPVSPFRRIVLSQSATLFTSANISIIFLLLPMIL